MSVSSSAVINPELSRPLRIAEVESQWMSAIRPPDSRTSPTFVVPNGTGGTDCERPLTVRPSITADARTEMLPDTVGTSGRTNDPSDVDAVVRAPTVTVAPATGT